jgi:hypothetical protein
MRKIKKMMENWEFLTSMGNLELVKRMDKN